MRIMKRNFLYLNLILISIIILFGSCKKCIKGEGSILTETRYLGYFDGVIIEGSYDVDIYQDSTISGDSIEVEVTTYETIFPYVSTEVENSNDLKNLVISTANDRCLRTREDPTIVIRLPLMAYLEHNGAGQVRVYDAMADKSKILLNGNGDISYTNLNTYYLDAEVNGYGDIFFTDGGAEISDLKITGTGNIDALYLPTNICDAKISGNGDIAVRVYQELDIYISGKGTVSYSGKPETSIEMPGEGSVVELSNSGSW